MLHNIFGWKTVLLIFLYDLNIPLIKSYLIGIYLKILWYYWASIFHLISLNVFYNFFLETLIFHPLRLIITMSPSFHYNSFSFFSYVTASMQNMQPNQITDIDASCKPVEASKLLFTLFLMLYFVVKTQSNFFLKFCNCL